MTNAQALTATDKATGKQYAYLARQSWNKLYYSFDGGSTWYTSKLVAFRTAEADGKLEQEIWTPIA